METKATNKARRAIFVLALTTILWLSSVVFFNWQVDPFCLRCQGIDVKHATLNPYYQIAQAIRAEPDLEQIVVGTSRGGAFPADWLQLKSGLKTLNLSAAGSEVLTKIAFIRIAEEFSKLRSVIWIMDYFEFVEGIRNDKFLGSPALKKYVASETETSLPADFMNRLSAELDHSTFDASVKAMRSSKVFGPQDFGGPSFKLCAAAPPTEVPDGLYRALEATYSTYLDNILLRPQLPHVWDLFRQELSRLDQKGVSVTIIIPPYHPYFRERLEKKHPEIYQKHLEFFSRLEGIQTPRIHVVNFFKGLPVDTPGPENWADGDHFRCASARQMLEKANVDWADLKNNRL